MNAIERQYQERAVRRGEKSLFNPETALQFIDECAERGIQVFGFDGFLIATEDKLQPLMEDMLDFDLRKLDDLTYVEKLEMSRSSKCREARNVEKLEMARSSKWRKR